MILFPLGFLPYILCLFAIARYWDRLRRFQLIVRSAIFLGALKSVAIVAVYSAYANDQTGGTLALYSFAALLFPELFLGSFSTGSAVISMIVLALLFSFLWATVMTGAVGLVRRLGNKGSLIIPLLVGTCLAGPRSFAASVDTLPKKTIKVIPTNDVVVLGWVDPNVVALPEGANPLLVAELNDPTGVACLDLLAEWAAGVRSLILSDADRQYANAFLLKNSGNLFPQNTIDPVAEESKGEYRLFNRLQVAYRVKDGKLTAPPKFVNARTIVGTTPNPCNRLLTPAEAEAHVANGAKGATTSNTGVFQVNQGRLGTLGQAVDRTLNDPGGTVGATTPWIWSAIKFDDKGELVYPFTIGTKGNHQIFPTYFVYKDGRIDQTLSFTQSHPETFISLDETSQIPGAVP